MIAKIKASATYLPIAILIVTLVLFPLFTVWYVTQNNQIVDARFAQNIRIANARWCTLLHDITQGSNPPKVAVPGPKATKAQITAYKDWKFHSDLLTLEKEIGCP